MPIFPRLAAAAPAALSILLVHAPARADLLLNGCGSVTIQEGMTGVMTCMLMNTGDDPVKITDSFVFALPVGPDFSDKVVGIAGVGDGFPTIDPKMSHDFQYLLRTPAADTGEPVDYGISIVNAIYDGTDTVTDAFVPGKYTGGVAYVLDAPGVPTMPPKVPPKQKTVGSRDDFDVQYASGVVLTELLGGGRFVPVPAPGPLALLLPAALLALLVRRKSADGRLRTT